MISFKFYNDPAAALAYVGKRLEGRNDGNGIPGTPLWFGEGADYLGLRGSVKMEAVAALCGNRHPRKGWGLVPPERQAHAMPLLTEVVVSSDRLPAVDLEEDHWFKVRHREAVGVIAGLLEAYAGAERGAAGFLHVTGNVVGLRFERCCIRLDAGRLSTHFVLFNLTFDQAGGGWCRLDTSEMELALSDMADEYAYVMRRRNDLLAVLEALSSCEDRERPAPAPPFLFGLN